MPKIKWDAPGERLYETGIKNAVLYPWMPADAETTTPAGYTHGYAWNGFTALTESPSGAEATPLWADDMKYIELRSAEEYGGTIEAYMYPDQFAECDGSAEIATGVTIGQQNRKKFGLAYKTTIGNDEVGNDYGYKIHLVYNCTASPSEKPYTTINDSPEGVNFSWEFTTVPESVKNKTPTATVTIDSTKFKSEAQQAKLTALEEILFGRDAYTPESGDPITDLIPRLPSPDEIVTLLTA